jgi:hypothetical protein
VARPNPFRNRQRRSRRCLTTLPPGRQGFQAHPGAACGQLRQADPDYGNAVADVLVSQSLCWTDEEANLRGLAMRQVEAK